MKIEFGDKFIKSLKRLKNSERWFVKLYDLFRYDLPRFFRNVKHFRKELWDFQRWDRGYNLRLFKRSLELTADYIEKYGYEVEVNRNKKVAKIRRVIELLDNQVDDKYMEIAEKELNKTLTTDYDFVKVPDKPGLCELVSKNTPEEDADNKILMKRSREIEEEQWNELWRILKGPEEQYIPNYNDNDAWDKWFDGSDIRGWCD